MARKTGDYYTEHIESENAAGYLNAVIEEEDKDALLLALRNIAEAEGGMAAVAYPTKILDLTISCRLYCHSAAS